MEEHKMIILSNNKEIRMPLTEYLYELLKKEFGHLLYVNGFIFLGEDDLIKALDNAVKNRLF